MKTCSSSENEQKAEWRFFVRGLLVASFGVGVILPSVSAQERPGSTIVESLEEVRHLTQDSQTGAGCTEEVIAAPRPCTPEFERVMSGRIQISRYLSRETQKCIVSISGYTDSQGNRRGLYWSGTGEFSVTVSLNREGPSSRNNFVRGFALFPRKNTTPDFMLTPEGGVQIRHTNSEVFALNPGVRLTSYSGGKIDLVSDDPLNPQDQGGISIVPRSGLLLDYGWGAGDNPKVKTKGKSTFTDSRGSACTVTNSEILVNQYFPDGRLSHASLKHGTDKELRAFLSEKCPQLDVSSLDP